MCKNVKVNHYYGTKGVIIKLVRWAKAMRPIVRHTISSLKRGS